MFPLASQWAGAHGVPAGDLVVEVVEEGDGGVARCVRVDAVVIRGHSEVLASALRYAAERAGRPNPRPPAVVRMHVPAGWADAGVALLRAMYTADVDALHVPRVAVVAHGHAARFCLALAARALLTRSGYVCEHTQLEQPAHRRALMEALLAAREEDARWVPTARREPTPHQPPTRIIPDLLHELAVRQLLLLSAAALPAVAREQPGAPAPRPRHGLQLDAGEAVDLWGAVRAERISLATGLTLLEVHERLPPDRPELARAGQRASDGVTARLRGLLTQAADPRVWGQWARIGRHHFIGTLGSVRATYERVLTAALDGCDQGALDGLLPSTYWVGRHWTASVATHEIARRQARALGPVGPLARALEVAVAVGPGDAWPPVMPASAPAPSPTSALTLGVEAEADAQLRNTGAADATVVQRALALRSSVQDAASSSSDVALLASDALATDSEDTALHLARGLGRLVTCVRLRHVSPEAWTALTLSPRAFADRQEAQSLLMWDKLGGYVPAWTEESTPRARRVGVRVHITAAQLRAGLLRRGELVADAGECYLQATTVRCSLRLLHAARTGVLTASWALQLRTFHLNPDAQVRHLRVAAAHAQLGQASCACTSMGTCVVGRAPAAPTPLRVSVSLGFADALRQADAAGPAGLAVGFWLCSEYK